MENKNKKYIPRLLVQYQKEITNSLMKKFAYNNIMQVPKVVKISLNMGVGEATQDTKFLDGAVEDLTNICGQKAIITRAKKSISNFKLRAGMPIGCRVTLRRWRMYEFLDRFLNVAIPRVRDFRGIDEKSFDGKGNFTIGIKEQIIFPEINYDKVIKVRGLNVTIVTTAETDEEAYELFRLFGMPFRKREGILSK
jgi:large subunit ribosomal protein L5